MNEPADDKGYYLHPEHSLAEAFKGNKHVPDASRIQRIVQIIQKVSEEGKSRRAALGPEDE